MADRSGARTVMSFIFLPVMIPDVWSVTQGSQESIHDRANRLAEAIAGSCRLQAAIADATTMSSGYREEAAAPLQMPLGGR